MLASSKYFNHIVEQPQVEGVREQRKLSSHQNLTESCQNVSLCISSKTARKCCLTNLYICRHFQRGPIVQQFFRLLNFFKQMHVYCNKDETANLLQSSYLTLVT